ncbi:hypothetical protein DEU38_121103 [Rhodococcus sp. AG1013]|nr:hypothetical protein DEU38_121103 [Rhodococcus sp. AG1013]
MSDLPELEAPLSAWVVQKVEIVCRNFEFISLAGVHARVRGLGEIVERDEDSGVEICGSFCRNQRQNVIDVLNVT